MALLWPTPNYISEILLVFGPGRSLRSYFFSFLAAQQNIWWCCFLPWHSYNLPEGQRGAETFNPFQHEHKTHLFNLAFMLRLWSPYLDVFYMFLICNVWFSFLLPCLMKSHHLMSTYIFSQLKWTVIASHTCLIPTPHHLAVHSSLLSCVTSLHQLHRYVCNFFYCQVTSLH